MTSIEEVTIGAFSQPLVGMSFIISVLGSWVGLTCANRARHVSGSASWLWLFGAAASIGGGAIWSMHFIGMLAFNSHVVYALDVGTTIISLVVAVVAAMVGLLITTALRGTPGYVVGGLVTGAGVCAMHYTGMYAMKMGGEMVWKPLVVIASVVIALVASALALFFAFTVTTRVMRTGAAVIMGIGVCVMHYTGMLALEIHGSDKDMFAHANGTDPVYLAMPIFAISAGMLIVIAFGTMFAGIDDDLEAPWTPDSAVRSGPHDAARPFANSGPHYAMDRGPSSSQPLQALPVRQPPAPDDPRAAQIAPRGIGEMFGQRPAARYHQNQAQNQAQNRGQAPDLGQPPQQQGQRPQRPTQLRPQNGRWTPRPYAQEASNNFPARRADRFNPQDGQFGDNDNQPPPAPDQGRPQRSPGWLPPRNNNL